MSRQIVLQRKVHVQCWHVLGQVAKAKKRMELIPILRQASKIGGTDAKDVAGHLLFEPISRTAVASRMLNLAQSLGLIEEQKSRFLLTENGEMALKTEQIFVPEYGVWKVWASSDVMLNAAILRVDVAQEANAFDEVMGKDKAATKERNIEYLPSWLTDCTGKKITPAAANGGAIRVDELERKGESIGNDAALNLVWNVTEGSMQLVGTINGTEISTALPAPNLSVADVWQQMLEGEDLWSQWDQSYEALRVDFDSTDLSVREVMACDLDFEQPEINGLGAFDRCTVASVALRAASESDAQLWAEWRLQQRIRDYATTQRFAQWQQEAVQPFTDEFQPRLPRRDEMANQAWATRGVQPAASVWHLVAAKDWGM